VAFGNHEDKGSIKKMVEKEILKQILFLNDLADPVLDKIAAIAKFETFDEQSILFHQHQELTHLYMLVSGKVFLNIETASGKLLTLDKIYEGRTIGISALMPDSASTYTALCKEKSSIITMSGEKMHQLFTNDFKIGHILMLKVLKLFKSRMEMHTRQFLLSLATHPEISKL